MDHLNNKQQVEDEIGFPKRLHFVRIQVTPIQARHNLVKDTAALKSSTKSDKQTQVFLRIRTCRGQEPALS